MWLYKFRTAKTEKCSLKKVDPFSKDEESKKADKSALEKKCPAEKVTHSSYSARKSKKMASNGEK